VNKCVRKKNPPTTTTKNAQIKPPKTKKINKISYFQNKKYVHFHKDRKHK
jgi:hypothetical protein